MLCNHFLDSKEYLSYVDGTAAEDDDGDEDIEKTPDYKKIVRKTSATVADLVNAAICNNAAGAYRYLLHSLRNQLVGQEKNKRRAAQPLMKSSLPISLRLHPTPMSNRAMDVVSKFLRSVAVDSGLFGRTKTDLGKCVSYQHQLFGDLLTLMFQGTIIRFTGRVNAFRNYANHMKKTTKIPTMDDANEFLMFLKMTVERKKTQTLGQWTSGQHKSSIPKTLSDCAQFSKFILVLKDRLPATLEAMLDYKDDGTQSDPRKHAVSCLQSMLSECCDGDHTGNVHFLAQLIVSDVEEIFDFPFGIVVSSGVVAGNGGANGYQILRNGAATEVKTLSTALDMVVDHIEKMVPDDHLLIAGYERRPGTHKVFNIVNGRHFNATDAEHFLCKGWVLTKLTFGHYRNSKYPKSAKPHCHPERPSDDSTGPTAKDPMYTLMKGIVENYELWTSHKKTFFQVPQLCLMPGECTPGQNDDPIIP